MSIVGNFPFQLAQLACVDSIRIRCMDNGLVRKRNARLNKKNYELLTIVASGTVSQGDQAKAKRELQELDEAEKAIQERMSRAAARKQKKKDGDDEAVGAGLPGSGAEQAPLRAGE